MIHSWIIVVLKSQCPSRFKANTTIPTMIYSTFILIWRNRDMFYTTPGHTQKIRLRAYQWEVDNPIIASSREASISLGSLLRRERFWVLNDRNWQRFCVKTTEDLSKPFRDIYICLRDCHLKIE